MRAGASVAVVDDGFDVTTGVAAVAGSGAAVAAGAGAGSGGVAAAMSFPVPAILMITDLLEGTSLKSCVDFNSSTTRVVGGLAENSPARTPLTSP